VEGRKAQFAQWLEAAEAAGGGCTAAAHPGINSRERGKWRRGARGLGREVSSFFAFKPFNFQKTMHALNKMPVIIKHERLLVKMPLIRP
jgi:hypothetical protein